MTLSFIGHTSSYPSVRRLPDNAPGLSVMSAWHLVKQDMIARKVKPSEEVPMLSRAAAQWKENTEQTIFLYLKPFLSTSLLYSSFSDITARLDVFVYTSSRVTLQTLAKVTRYKLSASLLVLVWEVRRSLYSGELPL